MMSLDVIRKLAELGADLPLNVVIKEEDKYYALGCAEEIALGSLYT